jgi:electron transfer flavoprotein alpha subunit
MNTREWVSRVAARLATGATLDCVRLGVEDGQVVMTKPVYGGSVLADYIVRGRPQLGTLRPGAYEADHPVAGEGRVVRLEVPSVDSRTAVEEIPEPVMAGPRLRDAKVIVAGGSEWAGANTGTSLKKQPRRLGQRSARAGR